MTNTSNDDRERGVEDAIWQFLDAQLRGSARDVEELVRKYPEFEDRIRLKIREFQKVDSLFDFLSQADESDFEDIKAEQDLVGQKIGSFEITKMIGRGGMGVVYLARDTKLKRSVALKSIPAKLADDSISRNRFRREAELLASLNHPNIAVIHEIIEEDKSGYLILEYVPGQTLAERIAHEPLELKEALFIGQQVADAISTAHEKGVVHRDLKPGNIKITPEGRVKVLDFGLAKPTFSEDRKSDVTATEPGHILGTPAYMSPEQARGKPIDHRTDIWSFGCIMYEMLTGRLPFQGETATDTLATIIERQPDWEALPQEIPANIRALLRRCLEKNPDRRLGDMAEVSVEINETLSKPATKTPVKLRRIAMIISIVAIGIILFGIALKVIPQNEIRPSTKEIRLVVLPFENIGSADDEWFADGMTDEITSRLAGIHGLGIISRQSAMQYKNKEKSAPQIAKELNVDYILEGTIQRERPLDPNSRVRIRSQLIVASDDIHLWAQNYDNDMSEVFRLQSEVAEQVAQELDILLLEPERRVLASKPTENTEAYEYYLRGNDYESRLYSNKDNLMIAIQMYEKAIDLDDKFSLAHAKLSIVYSGMYQFNHDRSEERLAMAWKESKKALELDTELPEAHWALGTYYYWGHSEYSRALKELETALKSQPKNSRFLAMIGYVHRRQGKYEQALNNIKGAFELNPLDYNLAVELGNIHQSVRKYPEAERFYERGIFLAPDEDDLPYVNWANLYLVWKGSTEEARAVLERASKYFKLEEEPRIVNLLFRLDVLDRKYEEALAWLPLESPTTDALSISDALRYAQIYGYRKKIELAEKYYNYARSILESKVKEDPNYAWFHSMLGIAYAGLGRKEEAIQEGIQGVKLLQDTKRSERNLNAAKDMAQIYVMVGAYDKAIDQLKDLLSIPGQLSIPLLKVDPTWKPLQSHPRFIELLKSGNPKK